MFSKESQPKPLFTTSILGGDSTNKTHRWNIHLKGPEGQLYISHALPPDFLGKDRLGTISHSIHVWYIYPTFG